MPIISPTDRRSAKGRTVVTGIYLALIIGGVTMVFPFLIMLTGAVSNGFDYERRAPLPRYLWSREDRFMHLLCAYFPPAHRGSLRQMRGYFPDAPAEWSVWSVMGDETAATDQWARGQFTRLADASRRQALQTAADDYAAFMQNWNLRETILAYDNRYVAPFLRSRYQTLANLNQAWEISIDDFAKVNASEWGGEPVDQQTYTPLIDTRYKDLLAFREAYRENRYSWYLRGASAGLLRPAALRFLWEDFVAKETGEEDTAKLATLPFPVPRQAPAAMQQQWQAFLQKAFPLRHIEFQATAARQALFEQFLRERFRNVDYLNRVMAGTDETWPAVARWEDLRLTATCPDGGLAKVWMDFLLNQVPVTEWRVRDTLPEQAFQKFALQRHGSLEGINAAYGTSHEYLEQLAIPLAPAVLLTFENREWAAVLDNLTSSYVAVMDYLVHRGLAVRNTLILVVLAIFISLTVNPLAAYALSRFRLRQTEKIVVFCLATMAFPAAVAAIPGFLLLRDLGLLNTFAALVLPGAANGMTIFLLKGFFDSLPAELYEAATIDGAPEWQVFLRISLPLVKPILAVGMLHAFLAAYNGWEWAIIVCQDPKMWTIAVWTYQFSQTITGAPNLIMASFIVNSIPVLLVFLFCQKIILRGIILPQMK
jgi:multiple sugar transport system permease protein